MLSQFNNVLLNSFYLWFQNKLTDSSVKAYATNQANVFTYVGAADSAGSWLSYQGKYRQLVPDENVDVPNSGVFVDDAFFSGDTSSFYIDYDQGRIITPVGLGTSLEIEANSTVAEVNTYFTNDDPVNLLLHNDFVVAGSPDDPYLYTKTDLLDDKVYMVPACFISMEDTNNKPLCFGGEETTTTRVRVFVVAQDNFTLDGILSVFADTVRGMITHIPDDEFPFGAFFSIKDFPYNYDTLADSQPNMAANHSFIADVACSKINNNRMAVDVDKTYSLGFMDFDLETHRFPRA